VLTLYHRQACPNRQPSARLGRGGSAVFLVGPGVITGLIAGPAARVFDRDRGFSRSGMVLVPLGTGPGAAFFALGTVENGPRGTPWCFVNAILGLGATGSASVSACLWAQTQHWHSQCHPKSWL